RRERSPFAAAGCRSGMSCWLLPVSAERSRDSGHACLPRDGLGTALNPAVRQREGAMMRKSH
ncbi:hypothetical protein, partial [Burkholderia sp. 3C]